MIKHTLKKLPKNTIEILIDISWDEIQAEYKKAFSHLLEHFSFEGFRPGKVPASIAEKHIPKEKVYSELISHLVPRAYEETVKQEDLKPIISPKVELVKAKENENWQVKATVAEKPIVKLPDYKKRVTELKNDQKSKDIWVPGKDKAADEQTEAKKKDELLGNTLNMLLKDTTCDLSDLIVESELEKRLAQLVDDVAKIGLSMDAYLKSKNLTMEKLREQYSKEISDMYKLEFILLEIADKEQIKVEQADLDKLFAHLKDEKERQAAQANAYFYASVLRKQKTLDFLTSL